MKKLPDKPSKLIELALRDLVFIEKNKNYVVKMGSWHQPKYADDRCAVCFAGAVMARTLKVKKTEDTSPFYFNFKTADKLLALNDFSNGNITKGLIKLGLFELVEVVIFAESHPTGVIVKVAHYEDSPEQFKSDMNKIAKTFKKLGL